MQRTLKYFAKYERKIFCEFQKLLDVQLELKKKVLSIKNFLSFIYFWSLSICRIYINTCKYVISLRRFVDINILRRWKELFNFLKNADRRIVSPLINRDKVD